MDIKLKVPFQYQPLILKSNSKFNFNKNLSATTRVTLYCTVSCQSSIADVQQLRAVLSVAGVDLARDEREPPAARPRLLDQLLRLLRQARPEEVLSLDTRIDRVMW